MDDNGKAKNPIIERGLVVSQLEYDLISRVLASCAEESKRQGHNDVHRALVKFVGRMSHVVHAGKGLSAEQAKRYQKRVHDAFIAHDQYKLGEAVEELVAATLRLDPDPAFVVAGYLLQMLGQCLVAHQHTSVAVLGRLDQMLQVAAEEWQADPAGWPAPNVVLQWVRDTAKIGADNLAKGADPWPEDEG